MEHWDVSRLMFLRVSIGSVSGGPTMQLLKPVGRWCSTVFIVVGGRRRFVE
jgi:hypothetical protein